jgi:hypothetical protein
MDFKMMISTYDRVNRQLFIMGPLQQHIYENICADMIKSILFPCMSRCNIGDANSEFVQGLLIKLLYVIPKIKALILPAEHRLTNMAPLRDRIQILTRLEEFRYSFGCTSEIIIELSNHCPGMKKISIEYSKLVDDSCVEHLLRFRHLISLIIAETLISPNGYATLLSGLPQLEDINCPYPFDLVIRHLRVSIPSVRKFFGTITAGRSLVQMCPNIRELVLFSLASDPSDLSEFTMVAHLTIQQMNPAIYRLSPLITRLGPTLTSLKLFQAVNISVEEVIYYCTSLKQLSINLCQLKGDLERFSRELQHFQNVNELRLVQNAGTFDFSNILHMYVNLNILHVEGMEHMTEALITRIISVGGFRNINEFVAEQCGDLSLNAVALLMESCPSLIFIGNLSSWPDISEEQLDNYLEFVKVYNLSLIVSR